MPGYQLSTLSNISLTGRFFILPKPPQSICKLHFKTCNSLRYLRDDRKMTKWNPIWQVCRKGLCWGRQGWDESKWAQFSTSFTTLYSTTVSFSKLDCVDFQIGFCEFPSFLHCALCMWCVSISSTLHTNFSPLFSILYFSPLCKTVCPSHPSLTQTFPQWPIIQFTLARNREELAFKFSIIVLHQGRGHPIENFANVINESNIFRIQLLHWNIKMLFSFLQKRHASNFKRDLFYFQLTSGIPLGIQRIRTHIGWLSFISSILSDMANSNMIFSGAI